MMFLQKLILASTFASVFALRDVSTSRTTIVDGLHVEKTAQYYISKQHPPSLLQVGHRLRSKVQESERAPIKYTDEPDPAIFAAAQASQAAIAYGNGILLTGSPSTPEEANLQPSVLETPVDIKAEETLPNPLQGQVLDDPNNPLNPIQPNDSSKEEVSTEDLPTAGGILSPTPVPEEQPVGSAVDSATADPINPTDVMSQAIQNTPVATTTTDLGDGSTNAPLAGDDKLAATETPNDITETPNDNSNTLTVPSPVSPDLFLEVVHPRSHTSDGDKKWTTYSTNFKPAAKDQKIHQDTITKSQIKNLLK